MLRFFAVGVVFSCLASFACAQTQPVPAASAAKPDLPKPAQDGNKVRKQTARAESGRCQIGVIAAVGDRFAVQKVGLTVFNNDYAEVPIEAWGLDELVVARVRAAAPGTSVRRIAYPKGAFTTYDNPAPALFRNSREELAAIVKQLAGNASCDRYFVFTKFSGKLDGTNQTLRGIGVVNFGSRLISHTSLFANVGVTVLDGRSFAIAERPALNLGLILERSLRLTRDPLTVLDNASFPDPATLVPNSATLRDRTRALLTAKLDQTLPAYLRPE
jgi:hypothetical protein